VIASWKTSSPALAPWLRRMPFLFWLSGLDHRDFILGALFASRLAHAAPHRHPSLSVRNAERHPPPHDLVRIDHPAWEWCGDSPLWYSVGKSSLDVDAPRRGSPLPAGRCLHRGGRGRDGSRLAADGAATGGDGETGNVALPDSGRPHASRRNPGAFSGGPKREDARRRSESACRSWPGPMRCTENWPILKVRMLPMQSRWFRYRRET